MRFDLFFKHIIPQFQYSIIPIVSEANYLVDLYLVTLRSQPLLF